MTRLQLSRLQEAHSRRASTPTATVLAQDMQGSDTSPRCESRRHGRRHPTGEASQGNTSILSNLFCITFLFLPAAATFSIPHFPKETQPLCSSGDTPQGSSKARTGCVSQVQPFSSPVSAVFVQTSHPENIQEMQEHCADTKIDL